MPDADMDMTTRILADSAFGCGASAAWPRRSAITVGEARKPLTDQMVHDRRKPQGRIWAGSGHRNGSGDFSRVEDTH